MRLGVCLPQLGPAAQMPLVADFAVEAERAGCDSLWVEEHLFRPLAPISGYGGVPGKPWPVKHAHALAPLEVLAFVAGRTERCTLGTSVLVVGYHHPLVLAKATATVDLLSGGRLALGLGVGWCEDEYRIFGASFQHRGQLADEVLEALHLCWSSGPVEYHGRHVDIPPCQTSPPPYNGVRVRTYGGFVSRAGWRRTARWCDVWQPFGLQPDIAVEQLDTINELAVSEFGRDPLELSLRVLASPVAHGGQRTGEFGPMGRSTGRWVGDVESLCSEIVGARQAGCHELVLDSNFAPGSDEPAFWEDVIGHLPALLEAAHTDAETPLPGLIGEA
ncbi:MULTISPECIES: TIGR03619 family F420-dependent LLM class oxidoreductase [unclassified Mycobacterium]|uniref:TIGR03619 family F420-dependent LLM class oxidoreductase n=1 Tax=unclassified Mycobacterium TaxID=2642494 RepID=UPI0029C6383E|nr:MULTISPECIES: TIGR03619 family F420-dependent LLM class oxidoreductase [unclassified Mycobacterium]